MRTSLPPLGNALTCAAATQPFNEELHDKVLRYQDGLFVDRAKNVNQRKEVPNDVAQVRRSPPSLVFRAYGSWSRAEPSCYHRERSGASRSTRSGANRVSGRAGEDRAERGACKATEEHEWSPA